MISKGFPRALRKLYERVASLEAGGAVTAETVTSAGGAVTIPEGSTLAEALKILADAVDPS